MSALEEFVSISTEELNQFIEDIDYDAVREAAKMIIDAKKRGNRLHITGIGKPAHVANYIASLLSSTGTPTYYLHGTEAVHGSSGQLVEGDIVICISNSGETAELKNTVFAIKNNGAKIISVTRNAQSWLGKQGDLCLVARVEREGGPLNRAPRDSVLAEIMLLQCLSVVLQEDAGITPEDYVRRHPGGALGKLRDNEK